MSKEKVKVAPKVEFAPAPPKADPIPPTAGIGPEANLSELPVNYSNGNPFTDPNNPEVKVDQKLLKAGVTNPVLPVTPINSETKITRSTEPMKQNTKPEVFNMNAPVREKVQGTISNSKTVIRRR